MKDDLFFPFVTPTDSTVGINTGSCFELPPHVLRMAEGFLIFQACIPCFIFVMAEKGVEEGAAEKELAKKGVIEKGAAENKRVENRPEKAGGRK